jgi:CreA protein
LKRIGIIFGGVILLIVFLFGYWIFSRPERGTTGSVSTHFRELRPNDKIVIDGFDDPKVQGVACHISRAQTGGIKGELGAAEDTSDASIACRQVVRFFDHKRNVLVYVAYSDRVVEGSPKSSISTVPIMGWSAP